MKRKFKSLVFKFLAVVLSYFLLLTIFPPKTFAAFLPPVVSDTQTEFFDGNIWQSSQATWIHPAWPHIDDATWIWKSATVDLDKLTSGEGPIAFRRNFNLSTTTKGTLKITADNAYSVALDGNLIGADGHLDPTGVETFDWQTIETYSIPNISVGNHTLSFQVTNYNHPTLNFTENPAGLLYRLDLESTAPFLDLPWDYIGQGKSFDIVAFNPASWFDHRYPLQNFKCCILDIMKYTGDIRNEFYKSHNGYDYGSDNGVLLNTPVLAAASGWATFVAEANSDDAGNVIKIDHGNGYQTWYQHLQKDGLIISTDGQIFVNKGDVIGKTGMTGNATGPHIHFSVYNNNFLYGPVDPLGWKGSFPDPWQADKGGPQSFNLFIPRAQPQSSNIPTSGGNVTADNATITVPAGATNESFSLTFENGPFESISNFVQSVVPSFFLNAVDNLNQKIKQFSAPIHISYNYSSADLSNIDENSLKLYSFNEDTNRWDPIATTLDTINKIASGETLHFSQFALMGQVKDLTAPTTTVVITGEKGNDNWYRSNVTVQLNGKDNEGGIGLQYTLYTLNDDDWFEYKEPLVFDKEGSYKITYQSFDKAENQEERKTLEFYIDKTPPNVSIDASPKNIWPPDNKMVNITISGSALDNFVVDKTIFEVEDEYNQVEPTISKFGDTIQLQASRKGQDYDGRKYTIRATAIDLAGNASKSSVEVIVPHDQR